ncbi:MAG: thiamine phosphate synthase [Legionella sp.]|nr:thiamine phosphate synthase [Legionella sp.]
MFQSALSLCLLTQIGDQPLDTYLNFLKKAIDGGVTSVQFRDKTSKTEVIRDRAFALKAFLTPLNIPLIINDDVLLAKEVQAEGVHLGQRDTSPQISRQLLGPGKIIGLSIETQDELKRADQLSCIDYIGLSAVFPSQSKNNCTTIWGLDGLKMAAQQSKHPIIAIGGINLSNIRKVIAHGASGVALIQAIHEQPEMAEEITAQLIQAMNEGQIHAKSH